MLIVLVSRDKSSDIPSSFERRGDGYEEGLVSMEFDGAFRVKFRTVTQ